MDILEKEISDLKVEIDGYKTDLKGATSAEEKKQDRGLIIAARETLNKLLDEKKALQTAGTFYLLLIIAIEFYIKNNYAINFSELI
jgi:hypothetical protein